MSDQVNNGGQETTVSQNVPEMSESERKFYEVNPQLGKVSDEKKDEPKVETQGVKQEEKPNPAPAKQESGQTERKHKSGYERRIDSLTSKLRTLEQKLSEKEKPAQEQKKFSRESFKDDEEYLNHLAEQKAEEKVKSLWEEKERKTNESLEEIQQRTRFEREWVEKAKTQFNGNDKALQQYHELCAEAQENGLAQEIPQDVYQLLEESEKGALIHSILLTNDELRGKISILSPQRRAFEILRLEDRLINSPQKQEQKQAVTKAPEPVGTVQVSGSSVGLKDLPWEERLKRFQRENINY